uniref:Uncharacterized protein n=1 Tax=Rhizophora mucronata TaxID=61149 RepID=A0A2P2NBN4_RHIMU
MMGIVVELAEKDPSPICSILV